MDKLANHVEENTMPSVKTEEQLEEEFADYFIEKIKKLRKDLEHYPIYEPLVEDTLRFDCFKKLLCGELRKW